MFSLLLFKSDQRSHFRLSIYSSLLSLVFKDVEGELCPLFEVVGERTDQSMGLLSAQVLL